MHININVSDICNFSCSYCINSSSKKKMKRILDRKILKEFIEDVGLRDRDIYRFAIAGGEPLLYPHIYELVEQVENKLQGKKSIWFVTNGSLLNEKANELYKIKGKTRLKFSISVHIQQISINDFINDILRFGHSEDILCRILLEPGKMNDAILLLNNLKLHNIQTILQVVTFPKGTPFPYSDDEIKILKQNGASSMNVFFHEYMTPEGKRHIEQFDRIKKGLHPEKINYKGMKCCAGYTSLRLSPDNTCTRCFGFIWQGEKFNLTERRLRDISELMKPCICPVEYCTCSTFLQAPKWREPEDAPVWLK